MFSYLSNATVDTDVSSSVICGVSPFDLYHQRFQRRFIGRQ